MFLMLIIPCLLVYLLLAASWAMDAALWIVDRTRRAFWPRRRRARRRFTA